MADVITRVDELPAPPAPGLDDAVDDALVGLPAPPRARVRVLGALLVAVSVAASFLAWQLRDDVQFAFSSASPIELGDGRTVDVSQLAPNRMVHIHAAPEMAGAVRYTRPLFPGEHVVFPIAGRVAAPLFIQVDGTQVSPGDFVGRIIPFNGAGGRYARVGRFLSDDLGENVHANTYLIVDGVAPRNMMWAVGLMAFLLALAVTDLLFLARLLRPSERLGR
jgi:hypothetical protein